MVLGFFFSIWAWFGDNRGCVFECDNFGCRTFLFYRKKEKTMKKALSLVLALALCLGLCACISTVPNQVTTTTAPTKPVINQVTPTTAPTKPAPEVDNSVQYISDRNVHYYEAPDEYIVFFGLQNSNNEYVHSSGTAEITIRDDGGAILYEKAILFDKSDFTDWTNSYWDSSRYLCGLYIKRSELDGAASSSGKLMLKVTLDDGTWFKEKELSITDLPPIDVKIIVPEIPSTYQDYRYSSYVSTVQVSKLEYTTKVYYDGTATLTVEVVMKLLSKTGNTNESSTVCVGYKLYDSDGVVVDSGQMYSNPIAIGEASKEQFIISDLDPREIYTLVFSNAS
jgi:hypothetical protein